MLTDNQLIHRQYLESPVWKAKRLEALNHYDCICNRCKKHGTDVHHKTYERTGGQELMTDLEVLCRPCHEAHHRVEQATKTFSCKSKPRGIHKRAIFGYLSSSQKTKLIEQFCLQSIQELSAAIMSERVPNIMKEAARLLGCKKIHGTTENSKRYSKRMSEIDEEKKKMKRHKKRSEEGRHRYQLSLVHGPWPQKGHEP